MNNKELRRLGRKDLLELLIEQTKKTVDLQNKVEQLESELKEKRFILAESGSLAEVALKLNNVFSDADKAAELYLDNIRNNATESRHILEDAKIKAEEIVQDAEQIRLQKLDEANNYMSKVKSTVNYFLAEHPEIKIEIKE